MALQEPEFQKQHIKIQPFLLVPIREESWANIPAQFRKGQHKRQYRSQPHTVSVVHVNDISTPALMARFIRERYGYGKWVICFYDRFKKNRKFRDYFPCVGEGCKYWEGCKIKNRKLANPKKYQACKMNLKNRPNWSSRAWIEIVPKHGKSEYGDDDFNFNFFNDKSLMYKFWFWSSNEVQQRKKVDKEEMYF